MRIIRATKDITQDCIDALVLMGFEQLENDFFRRVDDLDSQNQLITYATFDSNGIDISVYQNALLLESSYVKSPIEFIDYMEKLFNSWGITYMEIDDPIIADKILCASNTRDMASKLQRVKSSNVWSYAFNPKDNQVGDMLMQFKSKSGGPGDIYIYYDVPSKVWRQLVGAPSKGHTFWKLIRNVYTYAKLTGDKRTYLPNGI